MTNGQLAEQYALMWFRDVLMPWAQGYESKQCQRYPSGHGAHGAKLLTMGNASTIGELQT